MYQRKLPQDPIALRQVAEERWRQKPADPASKGELELQKIELQLQIEELERVNHLLTAAVNCTPEAVFIKDLDGKYLLLNEAAVAYAGFSAEEILGRDDTKFFEPQSAAQVMAGDQEVMATGRTQSADQELVLGGQKHSYWAVKAPLRDLQGNVMGIVGSARDVTTIKEAERQVRESEGRLAEAQEIGGLGSFEVDLATWRGRCSRALCKIFGIEDDEPFQDFLGFLKKYRHPDDHEKSDVSREALLAGGITDEVEHRYLHPDGRERILHIRRRAVRSANGVATKLIGTVQDVTDRRRAEEQLRASEARYRTFVEHVTDAMFLHADDGTVHDVNQRACDSLGYSREELIGQLPFAFDPELTPEVLNRLHLQLRENQSVAIETRHRRKDGTTFPVEVRIRPFWIEEQRYSISLVQDITHRKQSEQELRASEARLRELADAIPQIVWIAAPDGGLLHLNARAALYTGVQTDDLTGWSWERVIHPEDLEATVRDWTKILQTGEPQPLEFRIKQLNGEYRWHITRQVPSRDSEGRIVRWYGTCTDIEDHKRAEEALRASEERYRTLFHSIPDPMFVFDPQALRFLAVNDAAIAKYGYSRAEFLQMSIHDIHQPEELPNSPCAAGDWESIFSRRQTWRHRKQPGDMIDVEITAHSLTLDRHPVCIVLARDVTDRRRAEAEVRRTTELLRVVTEGTPDAVFVKDHTGKYLLFNPAAARFVGKRAEEVIGHDDTAIFGPADAALVMELDRRVMAAEEPRTTEETLTAAGSTRTYLAMKAPYRDGNGRVVGTIGISRDITERKQSEALIAESQQRLQALFNNALNAILLASDEGQYVDANPAACEMLGYSREELLQLPMAELVIQDQETDVARMWANFRRDGKMRGLIRMKRKDGQIITAEFSAVANVLPGLHLSVLSDVTERRRQAEELAARQAELRHVSRLNTVGQMVAALSHEVAQPLAAISNYAASSAALIGGKEIPRWELVKQHIDHITQQSRRAADIIQRLREYCRKSTPDRQACDVNELLRRSVEMLSLELRAANIALEWDLAQRVPAINGDHVQLQQVFVNLILNARDALLENAANSRKIALRTRVGPDAVWIDVEDNGNGLSDEIASRLFEPFVTTKPEGMGIGLSICRSILHEHRGDISYHHLESGGVTFRVRLAVNSSAAPT
jgi:PAS domain S-box-containing protein